MTSEWPVTGCGIKTILDFRLLLILRLNELHESTEWVSTLRPSWNDAKIQIRLKTT